MKFVKKYSIVGLFFVALLLMVGCGANDTDASAITTEKIDKISVIMFDQSQKTFEDDAIDKILNIINAAKSTNRDSVQDVPEAAPLGKITINDDEEMLYYYQDDGKIYIEKPYAGIYEADDNIDKFFAEL